MQKRTIYLRGPEGIVSLEFEDLDLAGKFVDWIITNDHYTEREDDTFIFPRSSFVDSCVNKARRLEIIPILNTHTRNIVAV